ncbi:MAG: dihydropteroate synthase [Succinivibrio sp.]|nr:dihydropteroate synthase [Succinivibrio sp.]
MKLKLAGRTVDLSTAKIMGVISLEDNEESALEKVVERALKMRDAGAEFLEIGVRDRTGTLGVQSQEGRLLPAIRAICDETGLTVGVHTSHPAIMEKANAAGASFIVDSNALRAEGAVQMVAKLKIPVCLTFEQNLRLEQDRDPIATVSEFFYERIDACLNAGINRRDIIIDPALGSVCRMDSRLKLLGRMSSFKSFALPLSIPIPRILPFEDLFLKEHPTVALTLALYCVDRGVNIIRTPNVSDMAMALAAWQLAAQTARPHQLSKGIIRRLRAIRDRFRERRSHGK